MHVFAFIAHLGKFSEYNCANKDLLGAKSVRQRRVVLKDLSEFFDNVKSLEDCVNTVVPLDLGLSQVSIGIVQVAQLVQSLDQHVLLLPFTLQLNALLVRVDDHVGKDSMALSLRSNFTICGLFNAVASFAKLLVLEVFRLNTELEV